MALVAMALGFQTQVQRDHQTCLRMEDHEMATTRKRILINGTDSSSTNVGDNIILDGTDSSSTDAGSYLDYEITTYFYTVLTDIVEDYN